MHYVAMFHEVNEGSAIFKSINNHPDSNMAKFINVDSMLSDPHLWLTGEAEKRSRIKAIEIDIAKALIKILLHKYD